MAGSITPGSGNTGGKEAQEVGCADDAGYDLWSEWENINTTIGTRRLIPQVRRPRVVQPLNQGTANPLAPASLFLSLAARRALLHVGET